MAVPTPGMKLSSECDSPRLLPYWPTPCPISNPYRNGVPHVILPAWQDCYENAARAEWLGIGVYGNRSRAPSIDGKELSRALLKVMNNKSYKDKSVEMSKLCHKKEGRVAGAEKIVEIARNPEKMSMDMPELNFGDPQCKLYEVKNNAGMVLHTLDPPRPVGKDSSKSVPFLYFV